MSQTVRLIGCPDRDTWSGFHAGRVAPEVLPELARHLDRCPGCQALVETLPEAEGDDLVEGLRATAPADPFEAEPECRLALERVGDLVPANDPDDAIPEQLGEYRLLRVLGRGGMGVVYRAVHARLGREVAVKVVPPGPVRPAAAARFRREAAALGPLDHPNVVRATDAGEVGGVAFLVMELVDGLNLAKLVRACGPLPIADACEVARQAAAGLQHLARHGLVHRDVKPSNLMVTRTGGVKVLDLGLAAGTGEALTGTGHLLGTHDYLAPEQADDARGADARADVYALGCTLFFLLTGRPPFTGPDCDTVRGKLLAHATAPAPEVRDHRPDVPEALSAVARRMMAKDPADRFPGPADVAAALAPFCAGSDLARLVAKADGVTPEERLTTATPKTRRKRLAVAAAVAAAILLTGGLTVATRDWNPPPAGTATHPDPQPAATAPSPVVGEPAPARVSGPAVVPDVPAARPVVRPVAVLAFEERGTGAKDLGPKVSDLLFAKLAAKPDLVLVDRADLKKVLDELSLPPLGLAGNDGPQVGRLTGARLLVTGSVIREDKKLYLAAKMIVTETGRSTSPPVVEGVVTDDLGGLVDKLARLVAERIATEGPKLDPASPPPADRLEALAKKLGKGPRPSLMVRITERHIGGPTTDPAAQTEVMRYAKVAGFELLDPETAGVGQADVLVTGEGFSEVAGRTGGLVSVRARVELKAVDRKTGRVLAADRQTAIVVGASEQIAGKQALEDAAATLAERLLPKLIGPRKEKP